jgi:hypothetical protein
MIRTCLTVVVATAVLAACGDGTGPRVPTDIEVDPQTIAMETSDTVRAQAVLVDQSGRPYTTIPMGYEITWSTSAPLVAEVEDGLIQALRPGQAIITARAGALAPAQIQVTVGPRTVSADVSFSYSGHQNGMFAIDTDFQLDQIDWYGDWAFTFFNLEYEDQDVWAQSERTDGKVDWLVFYVSGAVTEPGTYLGEGLFYYGFNVNTGDSDAVYWGEGTVSVTAVTDRRMAGTFSMEMGEVVEVEPNVWEFTGEHLDLTAGTFDVPLVLVSEVFGDGTMGGTPILLDLPERSRTLRESLRQGR